MRTYEIEFKHESVKLAEEIGTTKAAEQLGIPIETLSTWRSKAKAGTMPGLPTTPKQGLTMAEELKRLRQENKELKRTNEILSKATAFFAQSRKK